MDVICHILNRAIDYARGRCGILPYVHRSSGNGDLLYTDNDGVYVDCKGSMVLAGISIQLHRRAGLDTVGDAHGSYLLGNQEKQAHAYTGRRSAVRNVSAYVQHAQPAVDR